jgi:hypothetical protein
MQSVAVPFKFNEQDRIRHCMRQQKQLKLNILGRISLILTKLGCFKVKYIFEFALNGQAFQNNLA